MSTQTVIQQTQLPEPQEQFLANLLEQAQTVSETGMPFAPAQLADLSPAQQQAIDAATSGVGSFAPFLQQGQEALQSGITGAAGANITPTSYQEYMDPFLEDVIQQQYSDIAEQGRMQQNQLGAQAVGSGAFGGSRQAIQAGEIDRNVLEQQARTGSQLRTAGFAQAQQLAGQAAQQQLQQAQLQGALGQGIAGLGQLGQQLGVQDINTLLGVGGLQQQQAQQGLNIAQQNLLAQQQLPFQQVGFLSDIFQGVPSLQSTYTTTTSPPPSATSQLLGLGIAGLGAVGQAGGFGNLFGSA
tara:strand:+ start:1417 stop:2310 length:894 start_codon:yes stop_codon:yes gene_type:complete